MAGVVGRLSWLPLLTVIVCGATSNGEVQLLQEEGGTASIEVGLGEFKMSTTTGSAAAGWVHVEPPVQLRWVAEESKCLQYRAEPKADSFSCDDDPAGEAIWVQHEEQLRQWGDQSKCLATEDGADEPQLRVCAEMNKDDGWSVPLAGAAHGQIKSIKQDKCLVPGTGTGPRSVKLGPCTTDVMKWRADAVDGRAGTCALRWPVTASKDVDQSGVPSSRVCYHSTGRSMGTWRDSVMFGSLDAHKTAGRLINNLVADAPSSTTDVQACAALCSDTAGCHSFNFHAAESSCELLQPATLADSKADFSSEADGWAFYTADIVTVGTSCAQACLPQTVSRLQFPQVGGKFEDSSPDLLPLVAANRFDQVLFPEPEKDKPEDGASSVHEECMAEVDGVTIEVTSSCEAAKSVQCAPDPADGSKETCAEAKEAHCRRMVLLPITYFGPEKAQFRAKCGHGVNEDTKVWHAARIALDDCSTIVNFNDHCGSVQANI